MNILHMQLSGGYGGIATLSRDIYKYSNENNVFVFLFEGGEITEELRSYGAKVYVIKSAHYNLKRAKHEYYKICLENNIDIIVSHTGCYAEYSIILYLLHKLPNLKLYMYEHCDMRDVMGAGLKSIVNKFLFKECFRKSASSIAISNFVRESALTILPKSEDKIKVIYNGIDLLKFPIANPTNSRLELIYVGRVVKEKGLDILIDALDIIKNEIDVFLTVVGDGEYLDYCKNLTHERALNNLVSFVGRQNNVASYLSKADFYVHPVIVEEGFGITIIEAMAIGNPCIAFDKGAIRELIIDEYNGFVVKECNAKSLADSIIKAHFCKQNHLQYELMRERAHKEACKYDIKKMVENFNSLLCEPQKEI